MTHFDTHMQRKLIHNSWVIRFCDGVKKLKPNRLMYFCCVWLWIQSYLYSDRMFFGGDEHLSRMSSLAFNTVQSEFCVQDQFLKGFKHLTRVIKNHT